ncbi:hypothetical protein CVV38_03680 [Candidatus Peregrinibacteria bacterium HGW-Peregrinibacteria-1]|jgi:tetratricopeptide (TPR) repeat protein|nr:MAG: hypothetical protein CVV38_03680 [Candidatus Peregrinibacteria bacterium HGW-Peregrinibacteria-1]
MKTIIISIWLVILGGISFIIYQISAPSSTEKIIPATENTERANEETIQNNTPELTPETEPNLSYNEYFQQGNTYFQQGDYNNAIKAYSLASQQNPSAIDPIIKLGDSHLLNNQPVDALTHYQRIYNSSPQLDQIAIKLSRAHINSGNIQQAKDIIWQITEEEPANEKAQYYKALILIFANEYANAESIFRNLQSTSQDPKIKAQIKPYLDNYDLFSYFNEGDPTYLKALLAKSMIDNGEYNLAILNMKDILKTETGYQDVWVMLGYAYLKTEQIQEAIDTLAQARTLNNQNPTTHFYLGIGYYLKNEFGNASKSFETAKNQKYQPANHLDFIMAETYFLQEKYPDAAPLYEKLLNEITNNLEIYERLITIYTEHTPNPQRATELTKQLIEKYPNEATTFTILGNINYMNDEIEDAKDNYLQAIEINPNLDIAHLNLGKIYQTQNLETLAKTHLKTAYSITQSSKIRSEAGRLYNQLNDQ